MNSNENELYNYFMKMKNLVFFIAIYLYSMGWTYLYYYLYKFGLSILSIDLNLFSVIIFSWSVIVMRWLELLLFLVLTLAIYLIIARFFKKFLQLFCTIIFTLGLIVAFHLSKSAGIEAAHNVRFIKSSQTISLVLDSTFVSTSIPSYYQKLFIHNASGKFKLLFENEQNYIVLLQVIKEPLPNGNVFFIPKNYVKLAAINLTTQTN